MKHRVGLGLMLAMGVVANAAEPARSLPDSAALATVAPAPAPPPTAASPAPRLSKPLDLRIGDVRKYMMPDEFREAISAPDADENTVVVEAWREKLPMKFEQPVPGGIIAPFWMLAHPLQAWRVLVPDYQHPPKEEPREPVDKVPPPIFRWGP